MLRLAKVSTVVAFGLSFLASSAAQEQVLRRLMEPRDCVQKRASSYDRSGGNADYREIKPGDTLTLLDDSGSRIISHVWITISSPEIFHLKELVLRMCWDDEPTTSVETPIGDFFGLGLGDYFRYESIPRAVGSDMALNSFFCMPFQAHARVTVTNQGNEAVDDFYFNLDYQAYHKTLPPQTMYFHAQYRQAAPAHGWDNYWANSYVPAIEGKKNLDGRDNYVWLEASGRGHFVGVTMSVLQNQDGCWGEGEDMFSVDGEETPSINSTGSEDYFLGAWDFGEHSFAYGSFGAPVKGDEVAGSHSSVYRFHLDSPILFTKSLKATIEHGHANHRSDNVFSVAYWYQLEPQGSFPPLPTRWGKTAENLPGRRAWKRRPVSALEHVLVQQLREC